MRNIEAIVKKQRGYFKQGNTRDVDFRLKNLSILTDKIKKYEADIIEALKEDLNKSEFESYATEIGIILEEINIIQRGLKKWAKPKRVKTPIKHFLSHSYIYTEPYGVALIISPWNYPFQLAFAPLIGAIAAGNSVILKPSEYSSKTSEVISRIIGEAFDEEYICVVEGGREESSELLKQKFDHIFFTGSTTVGRIVMEAAAKQLTPVTLELGGKSPCIVDREANIELAAKRIVWGKYINAGQTCVAPDYLLVQEEIKEPLVRCMKKYIEDFYGENPIESQDYPRIINNRHFNRLSSFLEKGNILIGGNRDEDNLYIEPTIIDKVTWDDPIMGEEIFGPILPIIKYKEIQEVIDTVNSKPRPLALYYFTTNKSNERKIINSISYGGGCINDTIVHVASAYLPFGGIGESGMSSYHGKVSFEVFSHKKSVLKKSNLFDINLRYPPYENKIKLLRKILKA